MRNQQGHSKFQDFEKRAISGSNFTLPYCFRQSQIIAITMNKQSWKFTDSIIQLDPSNILPPPGPFIINILNHWHKPEKQKSLDISSFLQSDEEIKFLVNMAKFVAIFNVDIKQMSCFEDLDRKEVAKIRRYNEKDRDVKLSAVTKRKQFSKFFKKSMVPALSLTATLHDAPGLVLIIQNPENENGKYEIKILNYENLMCSISNNLQLDDKFKSLEKILDSKYKKVGSVLCYQKVIKSSVNGKLIEFLLSKFQQVFFVGVSNQAQLQPLHYESKVLKNESFKIHVSFSESVSIFHTHSLTENQTSALCSFYGRYQKIDKMIMRQFEKSRSTNLLFKQNELCISLYGLYYNFISCNRLEDSEQRVVQNLFLAKFIQQKIEQEKEDKKEQERLTTRKQGHYPMHIEKGVCKVCCVCQKKIRFKCEQCSRIFSRDIALCVDHFKQFHHNISEYIPKGVKSGTQKNEIEQFNREEESDSQEGEAKAPKSESRNPRESTENVLKKWESKNQQTEYSFIYLGQLLNCKNRSEVLGMDKTRLFWQALMVKHQNLLEVKKEEEWQDE